MLITLNSLAQQSGNLWDPIKPNFIFSSNISSKIYNLIHAPRKGNQSPYVIKINIQLNNLVSRNKSMKLSDLQDLINIHSNKHYILRILKQESWEYKPSEEIFIVTVKLILLDCSKEAIEFEQNESYTILKQCQFMDEIESYIKKIYLKYSEEEYLAYDISDSTIECSESEDNGELFGRYLEPLKSNDTLIDEFKKIFHDISDEEKSFKHNHDFIENISNLRHNDDDEEDIVEEELPNIDVKEKNSSLSPETPFMAKPENGALRLDDLIEVSCENEDDFELQNIPNPSLELPVSPSKHGFAEDDEVIKISRQLPFHSPTKERRANDLSRRTSNTSFSMISDERYGLEYAYNSHNEDVPSFIKENKKFKFIKVGKVQKFVNLFEEQKNQKEPVTSSRPSSRIASRVTSRTASRTASRTVSRSASMERVI